MKKKTLLWLILVVVVLALLGRLLWNRYGDRLGNKNKFSDQEISFSYPEQRAVITGTSNPYLVVTLTSPDTQEYAPTFNVTKEKMNEGTTLDAYVEQTSNQLKNVIVGYNQVDNASITVDGLPAKRLRFTGRYLDQDFSWEQVYTSRGDMVYVMTYLALSEVFNNRKEDISRAFNTFSFN